MHTQLCKDEQPTGRPSDSESGPLLDAQGYAVSRAEAWYTLHGCSSCAHMHRYMYACANNVLEQCLYYTHLYHLCCISNGFSFSGAASTANLATAKVDPFRPRTKPDQPGAAARKSTKQLLTAEHAAGSLKINAAPGEPEGHAALAMTQ